MFLPSKFHRPVFNRSEVIALTNKPTNKEILLKASTSLRYATPVENKYSHGNSFTTTVITSHLRTRQESCAIAKTTARCASYMSYMSFGWGL